MGESNQIQVNVLGDIYEYPQGTTLQKIGADFQTRYPHMIIMARVNGKLRELNYVIPPDADVEFITIGDKVGEQSYRRTATLILTKAVSDVIGKDAGLIVQFSMHKGYYCEICGHMPVEEDVLEKIEKRMKELIRQNLPIKKQIVTSDEAQKIFRSNGMEAKARLLKYRRSSWVNMYQLEDISDYYYGYMAPSTGYIKWFELIPFHEGFVIQMPVAEAPEILQRFETSEKIFHALKESTIWGEKIGVCNAGQLNEYICKGDITELMLVSEALQEKNISEIAEDIYNKGKRIVLIAGPSSSGKTTFSHRLSVQLRARGLKPHPIAVDNYFLDREKTPRDEQGNYNFECLEAINIKQFNDDMNGLLAGERVELPIFNFISGKSEYGKNNYMQIGQEDVLVIEGIHCLNDALTPSIPKEDKYKVYISALTQLAIDEHNALPTTDGRLIRRIVRDARTRNTTAQETIAMWDSVRRGEEKYIFPFQEGADYVFNSALLYELAVLKVYAEPLLFNIPKDAPEYVEAKRLLKFLDYFLAIPSENIHHNSLVREFIGGSCFNV